MTSLTRSVAIDAVAASAALCRRLTMHLSRVVGFDFRDTLRNSSLACYGVGRAFDYEDVIEKCVGQIFGRFFEPLEANPILSQILCKDVVGHVDYRVG